MYPHAGECFGLCLALTGTLSGFCAFLADTFDHLDAIVNNACQTVMLAPTVSRAHTRTQVRRPPQFFAHLMANEGGEARKLMPAPARSVLVGDSTRCSDRTAKAIAAPGSAAPTQASGVVSIPLSGAGMHHSDRSMFCLNSGCVPGGSAALSQVSLLPSDGVRDDEAFVPGALDVNRQQVS